MTTIDRMMSYKGSYFVMFLIVLIHTITFVNGYPSATFNDYVIHDACIKMSPSGHGVEAKITSTTPYVLENVPSTYTPGEQINVTLRSTDDSDFKGFMIQARRVSDDSMVGQYTAITNTKQNCANQRALTHDSNIDKNNLVITYTAPGAGTGDIKFFYTVVKRQVEFWVKLSSNVVSEEPGDGSPTTTTTTTSTTPKPVLPTQDPLADVDASTCGISKSCYRYPQDCSGDCDVIVTWQKDGADKVIFEMEGTVNKEDYYIAMGLSYDDRMGDDSVTQCTYSSYSTAYTGVFVSFNGVHVNYPLEDKTMGLVPDSRKVFYKDGKLICQFTKYVSVEPSATTTASSGAPVAAAQTTGNNQVFDLNKLYTILVAKGNLASDGSIVHHDITWQAPEKVNITSDQVSNIGGSTGFVMIKAHGVIMIVAWMISASIAIQMPRYHKTTWTDNCCGKAVWFQLHQPLMMITALLTIAGFIIIFVFVGGYSQLDGSSKAHPPLGIVTTALVIINPLMAACRPHPGAPKRFIFKIAHSLVGFAAHSCAVASMFLATYISKVGAPWWSLWVMVAYVIWQALIEIILAIHGCCIKRQAPEEKYEMGHVNCGDSPARNGPPKGTKFRKFMIVLHALGVISLAVALSYGIVKGKQ